MVGEMAGRRPGAPGEHAPGPDAASPGPGGGAEAVAGGAGSVVKGAMGGSFFLFPGHIERRDRADANVKGATA